jgi:hypothetical protein
VRGAPLAAFVIGSMSPDFEYLIRLRTVSVYSHTFPGLVTFCLPAGLAVYVVYRHVIAAPLRDSLPDYARGRLRTMDKGLVPPPQRLKRGLIIASAILFGALTHLLWDGFTHFDGMFVVRAPILTESVAGFPLYKYLQHGSTLAGFAAIAFWFHRHPPQHTLASPRVARTFWGVFLVAGTLAFSLIAPIRPDSALGTWVVIGMNALFIALLAAAVSARIGRRARAAS